MAKEKRSVALFEVIQKDKRFARQSPQRPTPAAAQPAPAATGPTPKAPPPVSIPPPQTARPDVIARALILLRVARARMQPPIQRLKPRLAQHSSVLLGVMAAITVIGALAIARRAMHPAASAPRAAIPAEQTRTQTAHPSVLDVTPATASPSGAGAVVASADADTLSADTAAARPAAGVLTPTRQINLNYVLIQSYGDEKTATEARDFLNKNGVPCTIERGVKNWRKDFYLVIGLQGFPRASGPDYLAYRSRIEALGAQFAPSPRSYKRFDPVAIKWDRAN